MNGKGCVLVLFGVDTKKTRTLNESNETERFRTKELKTQTIYLNINSMYTYILYLADERHFLHHPSVSGISLNRALLLCIFMHRNTFQLIIPLMHSNDINHENACSLLE